MQADVAMIISSEPFLQDYDDDFEDDDEDDDKGKDSDDSYESDRGKKKKGGVSLKSDHRLSFPIF